MKNYKHVSKSNNAMKLAAVASAAVMLAPVAMNSVSSFAAGSYGVTAYPLHKVQTVDQANANGTAGQIGDPFVGFNTSDIDSAIAALNAISTQDQVNQSYKSQVADVIVPAAVKVQNAASTISGTVTASDGYYKQLSKDNQAAYADAYNVVASKFHQITDDVDTARGELNKAAGDADKTKQDTIDHPSDTNTARYESAKATFAAKKQAYLDAVNKYNDFKTAATNFNNTIARKTNNGSVDQAAQEAARVIANLPAGPDKDAKVAAFNKAQGDYYFATLVQASEKTVPDMNKAAADAVAAFQKLSGSSYDTDTTKFLGTAHVNYNKNYGIQIWTKDGQPVRYNSVDAAAAGKKVGDAKKLAGQSNWKVFNDKYTANGTTYYNLGGNQYIDAAYVTFTPAK